MIIAEDSTPGSPTKGSDLDVQAIRSPITEVSEEDSPPPYLRHPQPVAPTGAPEPWRSDSVEPYAPTESAEARFFKALAIAGVIWFFLGGFLRITISIASSHHDVHKIPKLEPPLDPIITGRCIGKDDWTRTRWARSPNTATPYLYSSESSFQLPISSKTLYVVSGGLLDGGTFSIVPSDDVGDKMLVEIAVRHHSADSMDGVQVCWLHAATGDSDGVVLGPTSDEGQRWPRALYQLQFDIIVRLPRGNGNSTRIINRFAADIPHFRFNAGDLGKYIEFTDFRLLTSNSAVDITSLSAVNATIRNTNGVITGTFNTSRSLSLSTSNGLIKVNVGLSNDNDITPTTLSLENSNGPIECAVSLLSSGQSQSAYSVVAETSNAPLNIDIPAQPVGSSLSLEGRTSNSPMSLVLNPAYEGRFSLSTSFGRGPILKRSNADDPSGRGRERGVHITRAGSTVEGSVWWGTEQAHPLGTVRLETSHAPVSLQI